MEPLPVQPITSIPMESTSICHQDLPSSSSHPTADNANESLMDTDVTSDTYEGSNIDSLLFDPDKVRVKPARLEENPAELYRALYETQHGLIHKLSSLLIMPWVLLS